MACAAWTIHPSNTTARQKLHTEARLVVTRHVVWQGMGFVLDVTTVLMGSSWSAQANFSMQPLIKWSSEQLDGYNDICNAEKAKAKSRVYQ